MGKKIRVSYFFMKNPYMKFQNPSVYGLEVMLCIKKRNGRTHGRTDARTNVPEAICPSNFFEVGGIITQKRQRRTVFSRHWKKKSLGSNKDKTQRYSSSILHANKELQQRNRLGAVHRKKDYFGLKQVLLDWNLTLNSDPAQFCVGSSPSPTPPPVKPRSRRQIITKLPWNKLEGSLTSIFLSAFNASVITHFWLFSKLREMGSGHVRVADHRFWAVHESVITLFFLKMYETL